MAVRKAIYRAVLSVSKWKGWQGVNSTCLRSLLTSMVVVGGRPYIQAVSEGTGRARLSAYIRSPSPVDGGIPVKYFEASRKTVARSAAIFQYLMGHHLRNFWQKMTGACQVTELLRFKGNKVMLFLREIADYCRFEGEIDHDAYYDHFRSELTCLSDTTSVF